MDNPVDNAVDLGLVNYVRHPENHDYIVFRFGDDKRAKTFEAGLKEQGIWYETTQEPKRTSMITLFAVHKTDFEHASNINYATEATHKKPTIPFRGLRYFILLLVGGAITLACIGYCEAQKKIALSNESTTSVNP